MKQAISTSSWSSSRLCSRNPTAAVSVLAVCDSFSSCSQSRSSRADVSATVPAPPRRPVLRSERHRASGTRLSVAVHRGTRVTHYSLSCSPVGGTVPHARGAMRRASRPRPTATPLAQGLSVPHADDVDHGRRRSPRHAAWTRSRSQPVRPGALRAYDDVVTAYHAVGFPRPRWPAHQRGRQPRPPRVTETARCTLGARASLPDLTIDAIAAKKIPQARGASWSSTPACRDRSPPRSSGAANR